AAALFARSWPGTRTDPDERGRPHRQRRGRLLFRPPRTHARTPADDLDEEVERQAGHVSTRLAAEGAPPEFGGGGGGASAWLGGRTLEVAPLWTRSRCSDNRDRRTRSSQGQGRRRRSRGGRRRRLRSRGGPHEGARAAWMILCSAATPSPTDGRALSPAT
ncbi:unnamed protein product, partial [Ixodes pacificus]